MNTEQENDSDVYREQTWVYDRRVCMLLLSDTSQAL